MFSTITYLEELDVDWRAAYQRAYRRHLEDLRKARNERQLHPRFVDYRRFIPAEMSDRQINDVAWRLAEIDTERAIRMRSAAEKRDKRRAGVAL